MYNPLSVIHRRLLWLDVMKFVMAGRQNVRKRNSQKSRTGLIRIARLAQGGCANWTG